MRSYGICFLPPDLFHLAQCSPGPPKLLQRVGAPSFFLLHSIPSCKCTTVFDPLICNGHLGYFQHLVIVNNTAMNIGVHRFFWISVSGFLVYNSGSGITGSKGSSIFSFLRKSHTVFQRLHQSAFPQTVYWGSLFSTSLPALVCWFVSDGHSDWCEVVYHCDFNLHLSHG